MFRRREDGSEELINEPEAVSAVPAAASPAAPAAAVSTPASAAPAAVQASPSFRPVPPQAAMAAAGRVPSTPVTSHAPAESPRTPSVPSSRVPSTPHNPNNKRVLTVGPDIQMKGEITSCDRVVIEGVVDATMRDVHTVELTETGALKGTAEVEDAEISGMFEGDLTVRGKLTIYSSGRIRGNVTYGEIEIQRGGQISGSVRNVADAKSGSNLLGKKVA